MSKTQLRAWELPGVWGRQTVAYLESDRVSLATASMTFVFAIAFRNYLKVFSGAAWNAPFELLHPAMFYLSLAVSICLLLHFFTGAAMVSTMKVALSGSLLVVFAPMIDLLASGTPGVNITYFDLTNHTGVPMGFFTLGQLGTGHDVSPGQQVEIAMALTACYFYVRRKGKSRGRALLTAAAGYAIVVVHFSWPVVLRTILSVGGIQPDYSSQLFAGSFALLVFVTGQIAAYRANKTAFVLFVKDFNMLRLVHYIAMFGWGLVRTAPGYPFRFDQTTLLHILLVTASLFLAMLSIIPLERMSRGKTEPEKGFLLLMGLSLFCACLADFEYGFIMALFLGNFIVYHLPPVALHRVRLVSRIFLAANSLLLIIAGNLIRQQDPRDFDPWIVCVIMVGATAFGLVELVRGKTHPHSHRGTAILAGHLASAATMVVYQIIYSPAVHERLETLFSPTQ